MKILILGGTAFLGHHLVHSALKAGHEVTIFNRGRTQTDSGQPFPGVEKLTGDRDGNLDSLKGKRWDAVIDTSAYVPRIARDSARLLADAVDRYVFISTISVYENFLEPGRDEGSPVGKLEDPASEDVGANYGPLKAACEQAVEEEIPGRALMIRPGLIVGPQDPTDRFTYWPARISKGGTVLAPGKPEAIVQFIDVRDLADWIIRMTEQRRTGVYNATGPATPMSMFDFLDACVNTIGSDARLQWVDDEFLLNRDTGPWIEVPLWLPGTGDTKEARYLLNVDCRRALADGLTFRPLADTIEATMAWDASRKETERRAGLAPGKESQLLEQYAGELDGGLITP
ncbi:NAD-dependent epimerase/dehydratase family protein [Cohnella endophytica]|uniref:NAD-dependent epimerase/dehydratase family protein n=1 Tax=Cohnella endophytica TaxID=2419778 RepID=A0A494YAA7_9BACL|nr:NAD-dependent epimerase/dehydratase family protein [Cohnella endophytica]RKP56842.1 NAD-dependent epimerase/dehydratase family protein [Cohnella endophytica]